MTPDDLETAARLPRTLWPDIARALDLGRERTGRGRRVIVEIALDDEGRPTSKGSHVEPPRLPTRPERER